MNTSFGLLGRVASKFNFFHRNGGILKNLPFAYNLCNKPVAYSTCVFAQKFSLDYPQSYRLGLNKKCSLNQFSALNFSLLSVSRTPLLTKPLEAVVQNANQSRSLIKWSLNKGKKISDKEVLKRFKRLDWGIWIRPKAGAAKKLWKKKAKRINRLKQNVFCSASQSRKLDKMVTSYWRKRRVYPDDPYEPYMTRESYFLTRQAPQEYPPRKY